MSEKSLQPVAQVLARCHADLPWPLAVLEDDGDIALDWDGGRHLQLSLHVDADGHGGWAALVGDYRSHGKFHVPENWPADLVEAQQRYVAAMNAAGRREGE